jgi:cyclopropane-fatty-acyl-phospholipid synthase
MVLRVASRLEWGTVAVILPSGEAVKLAGRDPGRTGVLVVKNLRFARRVLSGGGVGFAEGYLAGDWDSPDMSVLLEVFARNAERIQDFFEGKTVARTMSRLLHFFNSNTKRQARKNIEFHYDLGNDFYKEWLDPTMTYSSAKFERPDQGLSEAQTNKYRALAERLGLRPEHSVLEIGCGWGGFAEYAAKNIGCRVTGLTISKEQLDFARARMEAQGLGDRVEIAYRDYRDETGRYDRVASIEMFEAVGERYWPAFFDKVREVLKPGGLAALQIITIDGKFFENYRANADFIQRYIFPGGMLPSPDALRDQVARAGLIWKENADFGLDYARTLAQWRERFLQAWPKIEALGFDERFRRLWTYYLSYCEAGFRARTIDVTQVALQRGNV